MEDFFLLSRYIQEHGYKLSRIEIFWHPARMLDGTEPPHAREFRGYFAHVYAINTVSGEEECATICSDYAVTDINIHFGLKCDDLLLKKVKGTEFSELIVWSYARYGDTFAKCIGEEYGIESYYDVTNKLNAVFTGSLLLFD